MPRNRGGLESANLIAHQFNSVFENNSDGFDPLASTRTLPLDPAGGRATRTCCHSLSGAGPAFLAFKLGIASGAYRCSFLLEGKVENPLVLWQCPRPSLIGLEAHSSIHLRLTMF